MRGYIFSAHYDGGEVIRVCVNNYAYSVQVKSMHAAKLMITKHANKLKGE